MELMKFEVTVSSHDLLRNGISEAESRFVAILDDNYGEAMATAAAMVLAREAMAGSPFDMVTGAYPYL